MTREVRTYTIERRGAAAILMSWGSAVAEGPVEVRRFDSVDTARRAAETDAGRTLAWREPVDDERRHDVVCAADV